MRLLEQLREEIQHSKIDESLVLLRKIWEKDPNPIEILEALHPISLFTFSHRFSTIHVPKEHEYLHRLLPQIPRNEQLDFLNRFVEYLAWSSKFIMDATSAYPSGREIENYKQAYLTAMESHKGLAALSFVMKLIEKDSLETAFRTILQVGCNDISQAIGHYFSCTESVIRLGMERGMPHAKNHIFILTLYMMQSSPIILDAYQTPTLTLEEILAKLVKKGGFTGYHYMILANGLIQNRDFIGEKHYLHALHGLEQVLPRLSDTLSIEKLGSLITNMSNSKTLIQDLKTHVWRGEKAEAFTILRQYLNQEGVTPELTAAIAHTYTKIDMHPHDPHYVTFPMSAFELVPSLEEKEIELVLAHSIEFAIDRIKSYGVMI